MTARSVRRRRGAGFLTFTLIGMPMIFCAMMLGLDLTRFYMLKTRVNSAATASAQAGAFQFQSGLATLDAYQAEIAARDTWIAAQNQGATGGIPATPIQIAVGAQSVTVTVEYRLEPVTPLGFIAAGLSDTGSTVRVERTAWVCVPGETLVTGGLCTRPD